MDAWGNGGVSAAVEESEEVGESGKGKKKGNKGKKQILMNWG